MNSRESHTGSREARGLLSTLTQEGRGIDLTPYPRVTISALSCAELRLGIAMAGTGIIARRRLQALETAEDVFGVGLPFDDRAAMSTAGSPPPSPRGRGIPQHIAPIE